MTGKRPYKIATNDLIWLCRALSEALRAGASIAPAIGIAAQRAPARLGPAFDRLQKRVSGGGRPSQELADWGLPSYIWGVVQRGEATGDMAPSFTLLADRLELEQSLAPPKDARLYACSLALGRLGMLLAAGVPILQAVESAAESVAPSEATDMLTAVRKDIKEGQTLSDAVQSAARG